MAVQDSIPVNVALGVRVLPPVDSRRASGTAKLAGKEPQT